MFKVNTKSSFIPVVFLIILLICISSDDIAAEKYSVNNIKPELLEDASAVIRKNKRKIETRRFNRIREKRHFIVTILTPAAISQGNLFVNYKSSFSRIKNFEGIIYDRNGKKIRELKRDEFTDRSLYQDFSVYEDSRLVKTEVYVPQMPYTVEYKYIIDHSEFYFNFFMGSP